jgi:hypothetical protein
MPSWIYRTVLAALSGLCKLFQSARTKRCSATKCRTCYCKLFCATESGLKRIKIVCRFPFFSHNSLYTIMVLLAIIDYESA